MQLSLSQIKSRVFDPCGFHFSDFKTEQESQEYDACQFQLNGNQIISRSAKITPKKQGQFVTFWKRKPNGPIEPFSFTDKFDFYTVSVQYKEELGLFIFPKSVLLKKGILSSEEKEGKRAFRVYPPWDKTQSIQAKRTQKWQLDYFLPLTPECTLEMAKKRFNIL